jgi:hypothetical protein
VHHELHARVERDVRVVRDAARREAVHDQDLGRQLVLLDQLARKRDA